MLLSLSIKFLSIFFSSFGDKAKSFKPSFLRMWKEDIQICSTLIYVTSKLSRSNIFCINFQKSALPKVLQIHQKITSFTVFFLAEVKLAVSSHIKYSLQAYWAVSIRELHMSLWRPWTEIREAAVSQVGSIVDPSHCQQLAFDLRWAECCEEWKLNLKHQVLNRTCEQI